MYTGNQIESSENVSLPEVVALLAHCGAKVFAAACSVSPAISKILSPISTTKFHPHLIFITRDRVVL
jgi:hypothetical protein